MKQGGFMVTKSINGPCLLGHNYLEFGITLSPKQYQNIKRKLEILEKKCPANSKLDLSFEKREESYIARITINAFSESFHSKRIAHSPYQAYLLIEKDIEDQILDWKRRRFSAQLEKTINSSINKEVS